MKTSLGGVGVVEKETEVEVTAGVKTGIWTEITMVLTSSAWGGGR